MTLTIIGDFERDELFDKLEKTFATLPRKLSIRIHEPLSDPNRFRQSVNWNTQANVFYSDSYKFYDFTSENYQRNFLMLLFLEKFMSKRLEAKLRFEERKAVYGIWCDTLFHGLAVYFDIAGQIRPSESAFARDVIEQEIEALRSASIPDDEFETDRTALSRNLRMKITKPRDLGRFASNYFYDPILHKDFPDVVTFSETVTKSEVSAFVRKYFVPRHQVISIGYPRPVSESISYCIAFVIFLLMLEGFGRIFVNPVDMTRISYVAKFRLITLYGFFMAVVFGTMFVAILRLMQYGYDMTNVYLLAGIDNFWFRSGMDAIMFMLTMSVILSLLMRIPHKLLIFEDHVRIKYLFYRSLVIRPDEITEIASLRFSDVWLSRRLFRCVPIASGLFSPALYMKLKNRWAYFFRVRNNGELQTILNRFALLTDGKQGE